MPKPNPLPAPVDHEAAVADKARRRILGPPTGAKKHQLPKISEVFTDSEEMRAAAEDLQLAHKLSADIKEMEVKFKEVKERLTAGLVASDHEGYSYGNQTIMVSSKSRTSLSVEKLLENDVTPEQIKASQSVSAEWWEVRLDVLVK